jgi:hypothetical protein
MYKNREKAFISFLEKNKIFTNFSTNLKQNEIVKTTEEMFNRVEPKNWFYSAFDWYTTPEGFDYWMRYNKKWQEYIN